MNCFFKQKTAYEMRISDWSADVCSSDLPKLRPVSGRALQHCLNVGENITFRIPAFFSYQLTIIKSTNSVGVECGYIPCILLALYLCGHEIGLRAIKIGRTAGRESVCLYV